MKLQQLRFLRAVVENDLNVTAAARALHTSQPGVSKQIRLLEDELGLELFVRNGRRLESLTAAGERIVGHAVRAVQESERIRRLAAELRGDAHGTLSLATTQTQARYVLPPVIKAFRQRFETVDFQLHQGTTEHSGQMLRDRRVDFAIVSGTGQPFPDAVALPLYRWDRVLVVPRGHELAGRASPPDLATLATFPLVTYLFSDRPGSSLLHTFRSAGLEPRIAFTARDADVIKTYVRTGFGVGVLASMAVESGADDDLEVIEAPPFPRLTTWVAFSRDLLLRRFHVDFLRLLAPHLADSAIGEPGGQPDVPIDPAGLERAPIPYRGGSRAPDNRSL